MTTADAADVRRRLACWSLDSVRLYGVGAGRSSVVCLREIIVFAGDLHVALPSEAADHPARAGLLLLPAQREVSTECSRYPFCGNAPVQSDCFDAAELARRSAKFNCCHAHHRWCFEDRYEVLIGIELSTRLPSTWHAWPSAWPGSSHLSPQLPMPACSSAFSGSAWCVGPSSANREDESLAANERPSRIGVFRPYPGRAGCKSERSVGRLSTG